MANYYYVKQGGTATGDAGRVATTKSTGSFATKGAANYYASITAALAATTAPAHGDLILCSDATPMTVATVITYAIPDGVQLVSVADANCDQYSKGAEIDNTAAGSDDEILINPAPDGWCSWKGFHFNTDEALVITVTQAYGVNLEDCDVTKNHISGVLVSATSSSGAQRSGILKIKNMVCQNLHSSNNFSAAASLELDNIQKGATWTAVSNFVIVGASLGATNVTIKNTDIVAMATAGANIFLTSSADNGILRLERCKIGASMNINDTLPGPLVEVYAHSCDAGDGYFYEYHANMFGQAEVDTTTYLNATYDGTNGFSTQIDTTAECSIGTPFRHKLGEIPAADLTSSQTVTVEASSATASLKNSDWHIELIHNDNTDEALGVEVSTQHATAIENADGTAHTTTGTGAWTSGSGNDYIETATPGALANVDNGLVEVWAVVSKPSLTINFDQPVLAAT